MVVDDDVSCFFFEYSTSIYIFLVIYKFCYCIQVKSSEEGLSEHAKELGGLMTTCASPAELEDIPVTSLGLDDCSSSVNSTLNPTKTQVTLYISLDKDKFES